MTAPNPGRIREADNETATAPPRGAMRCSDAECERTSSALRAAAGEGRLCLDEVDDRLVTVYSARFRHELDVVTADLPSSAETAAGWYAVLTAARRELAQDVSALIDRGRAGGPGGRRLVLALAGLAPLLLAVAMVVLALHGISGDGPEHGSVGYG